MSKEEDKTKIRARLIERANEIHKKIRKLDYFEEDFFEDHLMNLIHEDIQVEIEDFYKDVIANGFTYRELHEIIKTKLIK